LNEKSAYLINDGWTLKSKVDGRVVTVSNPRIKTKSKVNAIFIYDILGEIL
jgi:hypothetical protein